MCRECQCDNELQCSVKGYQPEGWCCEHCDFYESREECKGRFREAPGEQRNIGYCVGCQKREIVLAWKYRNLQKGLCSSCIDKFEKLKLLDLAIDNHEEEVK